MVEIICILDRSGSMTGLENDVIGSFNGFMKEQKGIKGKANVTLVLFDNKVETIFEKVKVKKVKKIDKDIYYTRGSTSLNDAIGMTLNSDQFKDTKKAIVWIQTDGEENSSKEYTNDDIKSLVKKKKKDNWEFIFMGANIDSFQVGSNYGFSSKDIHNYENNARGIQINSLTVGDLTTSYRSNN